MNTDPDTPTPSEEPSATESSAPPEPEKETKDFTKSVEDAFRTGASDAKKAFEETMPKAKEEFSKGIHDLAYALSYATAFGTELLKEITPDNITDGLREGSDAGKRAADEVIRERRERAGRREREKEAPSPDEGNDAGPVMV